MTTLKRLTLDGKEWGKIKILRPIVDEDAVDPWGELASLKGTAFESCIPVVSGEVFSHALHGYLKPLLQVLGPEPKALLRMVPRAHRKCSMAKACLMFVEKDCQPGKTCPDCYEPSGLKDPEAAKAAAIVIVAWAENRYVLVVNGAEFSLT